MTRLSPEVGYVHVMNERGSEPVAFGPDDDLPGWAVRQMGPHLFEDGKHPTGDYPGAKKPEPDSGDLDREPGAIPPKNGKGSGRDNWAAYANDVDVDIPADATRDQIIELIEKAGKPTEYEE